MKQLMRTCEMQAGAAPLFWTLGAKQPGRAAIAGWRDLLAPALRKDAVRVWPFHGPLKQLIEDGNTVVVEAYPAEAYSRLGIARGFGKQEQQSRILAGAMLLDWADYTGVELSFALRELIADGFGADANGEDRFDAVAGLFGLLDVALGLCPCPEPEEPVIREVEGWILGLKHGTVQRTIHTAEPTGDSAGQL